MDRIPNLSRLDLGLAAAGLATAVVLVSAAFSEPLVAPRVADAALAMPVAQAATARQVAVDLARRFGLAGTAGAPVRGADQVTGAIVDTVDFRFADGRLAAEIVRAADGRLQRVVDLTDPPSGPGGAVEAAGAPAAARRLLGASGLATPASAPVTTWDAGMDAWCVRWVRTIDGVPAPTDGLVTWVRRSGRLKALSDANSPLAAAPSPPIPAAAASRAVQGYVRGLHLDSLPSLAYATPRLEWVLPNGFVDPTTAADPSILRLAWAVAFSYIPPGWTERHTVEIDVDATTGALIGGTETA